MSPYPLIFVTGNANKAAEARAFFGSTVALQAVALNLPELQGTIEDIARDKCRRAADAVRYPPSLSGDLKNME